MTSLPTRPCATPNFPPSAGSNVPVDHGRNDIQRTFVNGNQAAPPTTATATPRSASSGEPSIPVDQLTGDTHTAIVSGNQAPPATASSTPRKPASGEPNFPVDHTRIDAQAGRVNGNQPALPTKDATTPKALPSAGPNLPVDHTRIDAQAGRVNGSQPAPPTRVGTTLKSRSSGELQDSGSGTEARSDTTPNKETPSAPLLADHVLGLASDVLDDLERTKISNENRLRQLTRSAEDSDGEVRGFGMDESHPDVARLAVLVEGLAKLEHQAVLNLQKLMRKHPLGPWAKAQRGVGEKQFARLLAKIGDPYWNTLDNRPRTVSQLWAYCGWHTVPSNGVNVAARRTKGQRANWSTEAKMRAYLVSESMLRAGNREVYNRRKEATEGRLHAVTCVRCGPSGKPAQIGSPWSDGHRHADALRVQAKWLLRELWREAARIHLSEEEDS